MLYTQIETGFGKDILCKRKAWKTWQKDEWVDFLKRVMGIGWRPLLVGGGWDDLTYQVACELELPSTVGRSSVAEMVERWEGGVVVVSHDRDLLRRMERIVDISGLGVEVVGGGYDLYAARTAETRAAVMFFRQRKWPSGHVRSKHGLHSSAA